MAKQKNRGEGGTKLVAANRKARHRYQILDCYETGLVLQGTEVKSLRQGSCSLDEAFARPRGDELFVIGMNIAPYKEGNRENHEPTRPRKLLMHKREIEQLISKVNQKGFTLVPLSVYFKHGRAKLELALACGKSHADRREDLKQRDAKREVEREMRNRRRS